MPYKITNSKGNIIIDNEVISKCAGLAAIDCYGIVGMAAKDMKDDIFHLLKMESLTKGIKIKIDGNRVDIDFHIIVEYGTNISAIADTIVSTVKYQCKEFLGIDINDINIFVEGVRVDG